MIAARNTDRTKNFRLAKGSLQTAARNAKATIRT